LHDSDQDTCLKRSANCRGQRQGTAALSPRHLVPTAPSPQQSKPPPADGTAVSKTATDLLGNRRFESTSLQRGVNNEPCSCRRLRLVAKQRRAFPNEKQGSGNRQYAELVGALTGRTVLSVFQFLVGVPHCPRKVGIGRSKMVGRYQQPARVDQISVRLLCRPLLRSLFHEAAGGAIKRARQVRIEL
jgi:hypothetical protein